jgi:hypothetical protein
MKLNRKQLRQLINEESSNIENNRLNEFDLGAVERGLTTVLGHAGVGDIAAGVKALTLDGGRLIYKLNNLNNVMESFGEFDLSMDDSPEFDELLERLVAAQPDDKLNVKESLIDFGDMLKTFLVSVVSAFPDGVISGPVAAAISVIPIESFFLEGLRVYAAFIEKIESIPGGSGLTWLAEMGAKATQTAMMGPLALFFTNPHVVMKNLGRLMEAASSESIVKDISRLGKDLQALDVSAEFVNESRWSKIAGIL